MKPCACRAGSIRVRMCILRFCSGSSSPKSIFRITWSLAISAVLPTSRPICCRGDHIWKPLGFLLLTIHWFNPVMWLSYVLLCRDIELACDEAVIKELGNEQRADYMQALVTCSANRRTLAACPLAFRRNWN